MKQKIAFALIMGIVTTGIISFTLITVNMGWAHLIVIPAILTISPLIAKLVAFLFSKNEQ